MKLQPKPNPTLSPQQYLDGLIRSRGYSTVSYPVLSSAYHNKPSPLQVASYGVHMVNLVNKGNCEAIEELLKLGLSPNACNAHGESILNHVCRRVEDVRMLDLLLEAGCVIQTSDQNGRTPLHHAFWAVIPNFSMVEKLLERDIRLLYMTDSHGHLPLSYIQKEHWSEWLQFFQTRKDVYWPRTVRSDSSTAPPPLTLWKPHTSMIRDPDHALPIDVAKLVASGKLRIKEAKFLIKTLDHVVADLPFTNMYFDDDEFDDDFDDESSYVDDMSFSSDDEDDDDEESVGDDDLSYHTNHSIDTTSQWNTNSNFDFNNNRNHKNDYNSAGMLDENELDTESWYERNKTLQGLCSPMLRPIEW